MTEKPPVDPSDQPIELTISPGDFALPGDFVSLRKNRSSVRRQTHQRRRKMAEMAEIGEKSGATWVKSVKQRLPTPPISHSGVEIVREDGVTDRFLCCRRRDNLLRWVTGKAIDEIGLSEAFSASTDTVERRSDEVR